MNDTHTDPITDYIILRARYQELERRLEEVNAERHEAHSAYARAWVRVTIECEPGVYVRLGDRAVVVSASGHACPPVLQVKS